MRVDTRSFKIYLPTEKATMWSESITKLIKCKTQVQAKQIECLIGRLNHIGLIIPHGRYSLPRLRTLFSHCTKHGAQHIGSRVRDDLLLWQDLIHFVSTTGVSINHLTYITPDIAIITDACEYGIGGYDVITGAAWRMELP